MATVHNEIDNWLVADLHGELSADERSALHTHLVDCAGCRKTHQATKLMNKILEETLAQEKPDPVFEQRMLAEFRNRIPQRSGFAKLLADLMHMRAVQIAAGGNARSRAGKSQTGSQRDCRTGDRQL